MIAKIASNKKNKKKCKIVFYQTPEKRNIYFVNVGTNHIYIISSDDRCKILVCSTFIPFEYFIIYIYQNKYIKYNICIFFKKRN